MPDEILDDFKSNAAPKLAEPPSWVWLYPTGEIEVLTPLARWEGFVKSEAAAAGTLLSAGPHWLSRFRRPLAVGAAFVMTALILGAGLLVGRFGPPVEPVSPVDVATDQQPSDVSKPSAESDDSDLLSAIDSPLAFAESFVAHKAARPRRAAEPHHVFHSVYRRRSLVPLPRFIVSNFVPTTLIIYIEKGEIKSRIEPQLTASYKKPSPPGN